MTKNLPPYKSQSTIQPHDIERQSLLAQFRDPAVLSGDVTSVVFERLLISDLIQRYFTNIFGIDLNAS